jgi:broad specificity phosphatase PhoE
MPKLILIKHAKPTVVPDEPPERWPLSDEGRLKCAALADQVRAFAPSVVVASDELKASETGRLVAEALGVAHEVTPGLHEHDRSNVPQMQTREFISYMALLFKRPNERVLGLESADEALDRFQEALEGVVAEHSGKDVAVVTHGTVIALYVAELTGDDPFTLWRRMGLPSFVVLEESRVMKSVDAVS